MTLDEQIAFFFAAPFPEPQGTPRSALHLNRREVQDCFLGSVIANGERDVVGDPRERRRFFATVMVMAAGIDLLAKFHAGSDRTGELKERW